MICCGPACVSFLVLTLVGSDLQWGPWWDSSGLGQCGMSHWSSVQVAGICLPVLSQEFCVASLGSSVILSPKFEWWVGVFFNHLCYCCSLGWLLNPVVTTRSLVTVCVHWICLGSGFVLLSDFIFSLQIQFLLSPCLFQ